MKNEMWKRSLRRGAALVLALVMSLTITSCSASQGSLTARERAREPEYVSKAGGKAQGRLFQTVLHLDRKSVV